MSDWTIILGTVSAVVGTLLFPFMLIRTFGRKRARGILCERQDGPDKGKLLAISLDGRVVLEIEQPKDLEAT